LLGNGEVLLDEAASAPLREVTGAFLQAVKPHLAIVSVPLQRNAARQSAVI
jgi:hypothetical protein